MLQELAKQLAAAWLQGQVAKLRAAARGAGLQPAQGPSRIMQVWIYLEHVVHVTHVCSGPRCIPEGASCCLSGAKCSLAPPIAKFCPVAQQHVPDSAA